MFGYVVATESIENYVVVLLSKDTGALYEHPSVINCHAHVCILFKKEKLFRDIHHRLINFYHIYLCIGKQVIECQGKSSSAKPRYKYLLRLGR